MYVIKKSIRRAYRVKQLRF